MIEMNLALYFDKIRHERKISQEDFIDGIISMSQFRNYLNNESVIPLPIIYEFSNRLGMKFDFILEDFDKQLKLERYLVTSMLNAVSNYDYLKFNEFKKQLDSTNFFEKHNDLLYHHSIILYNYNQKRASKEHSIFLMKKLINYPKILNYTSLNTAEFIIFGELVTMLDGAEQNLALDKLVNILNDSKSVLTTNNEKMIVMLIVRIIKILGTNNNFKDSLILSMRGINILRSIHSLYLLDYLYYYASLSNFGLGNLELSNYYLYLTFSTLISQEDDSNYLKFEKMIEDFYKINFKEFVLNYILNN